MGKEDKVLRFMLPDLLGKPKMMVDKDGNFIALTDFELPKGNYVFFIPIEEWRELLRVKEGKIS